MYGLPDSMVVGVTKRMSNGRVVITREKAVERAENDDEMLSVVMLAPFSIAGGFFGFIEKMANAVDRKAQNYVKRAERAERAKRARAKLNTN